MKILKARLYERELEKRNAEKDKVGGLQERHQLRLADPLLRPAALPDGEGSPHDHEMGDAMRVLDGDLDPFIKAYLLKEPESA